MYRHQIKYYTVSICNFTQMVGLFKTMQVFVNKVLVWKVCFLWVARLGLHPHTLLKLGARFSHSAGFLPPVPTRVSLFKASCTPLCARIALTHQTCPICPSWEVTVKSLRVGGPCCVYAIWQPAVAHHHPLKFHHRPLPSLYSNPVLTRIQ